MRCQVPYQWPGRLSSQKLSHRPQAVKMCTVTRKGSSFTLLNFFYFLALKLHSNVERKSETGKWSSASLDLTPNIFQLNLIWLRQHFKIRSHLWQAGFLSTINYHKQFNNAKFTLMALSSTYVRKKMFHSLLWWLTGSGHSWWVQCWRQMQNRAGSPWPATAYTDLGPVSICLWGCKGCRLGCRKHLQEQVLERDQKLSYIK